MPASVAPPLKYPTIDDWETAVEACQTAEELNVLVRELEVGQNGGTIHRFKENKKVGLARWMLNRRADKLDCFKMSDHTYRQHTR